MLFPQQPVESGMQQFGRAEQKNNFKSRAGKTKRNCCSSPGKVSDRLSSYCCFILPFLSSQSTPSTLRRLFWTDVGLQPSVERASLEGGQRVVIANTDLLSPSGLAIDFTEERLYWCDQRRGVVESAAMDGSDRQVLLGKQVGEACVTQTHTHSI